MAINLNNVNVINVNDGINANNSIDSLSAMDGRDHPLLT
jgi:hypothetical protein